MESKRAYGSRLVTEAKTLAVDYRMELAGRRCHTQSRRCSAVSNRRGRMTAARWCAPLGGSKPAGRGGRAS
jgi:hypothetical protein